MTSPLHASEHRYRSIVETAMDAIVRMDAAGNLLEFNPSAERMFGYRLDEVIGRPMAELIIPPSLREQHRIGLARYLAGGPPTMVGRRVECSAMRSDGTEFPVDMCIQLVGQSDPPEFTGTIRDLTERHLAAEQLLARDRRYAAQREASLRLMGSGVISRAPLESALRDITSTAAATLNVARVSVWLHAPDATLLRCANLYDARGDCHVSGAELGIASYPEYFRALQKREVIAADDTLTDSRTVELLDGYLRPLGITSMMDAPVYLGGVVAGVLCHEHVGASRTWTADEKTFSLAIASIVSLALESEERLRAERTLTEIQKRLQVAVSAGEIGILEWDLESGSVACSPEFGLQIGHEGREWTTDIDELRSRAHPDDVDRLLDAMNACMGEHGNRSPVEYRFRHEDGSYRHILARFAMLPLAEGKSSRVIGCHIDVTDRMELQARLLQSQKMDTLGQLAGGVAHDFNNLLTVINATADIAMGELRRGDPLREDFKRIHDAGTRAAGLTRQLLAFSRHQILEPDTLDLNSVIENMRDMLQRLLGESVTLVFQPETPLCSIRADPSQMDQVIMNLAVNGRDAMADGGTLTIETRNVVIDEAYVAKHPAARAGPNVMLTVSDTGVGMDSTTSMRIFEPFFTTKGPGKGTGLGLSTVYGIIKQSGGTISVDSRVGEGSTFRVILPLAPDQGPDQEGCAAPATPAPPGSETILVVEDEEALRTLAKRILGSAGYTVLTARDGIEALVALEGADVPPALLVSDVVLPGIGGRDLAERIQIICPTIKVLFTSGYMDDVVLSREIVTAGRRFLAKPYTPPQLVDMVRKVLDAPGV